MCSPNSRGLSSLEQDCKVAHHCFITVLETVQMLFALNAQVLFSVLPGHVPSGLYQVFVQCNVACECLANMIVRCAVTQLWLRAETLLCCVMCPRVTKRSSKGLPCTVEFRVFGGLMHWYDACRDTSSARSNLEDGFLNGRAPAMGDLAARLSATWKGN